MHQTAGFEHLLKILTGEPGNYTRHVPSRDKLPLPILKLHRQITGAANGTSNLPPRMQISTAYGVLTLEAKWLVPAGTLPADGARDPNSCLISVTIKLHEHVIAHAARVLRESGATPAQTKVGIQLALGKTRPVIADELGPRWRHPADADQFDLGMACVELIGTACFIDLLAHARRARSWRLLRPSRPG